MSNIRLVASSCAYNTSNLSVSDESNMYTDTDSTTYATITNISASTSSRMFYIRGFNFGSIPVGSTINSFTVKIRGYGSQIATGSSYAPRLANGGTAISGTTASSNFSSSSSTITIPTGNLTWDAIVNYGSDFTIIVYVNRSSRNRTGYLYVQGAEISVDYTEPSGPQNVRVKQNGVWVAPTKLLVKQNGTWVESTKILAKDNGTWK